MTRTWIAALRSWRRSRGRAAFVVRRRRRRRRSCVGRTVPGERLDRRSQPTAAQLEAAGLAELPLRRRAPGRSDRAAVLESDQRSPTRCSRSASCTPAILNGTVDEQPFKTETTLLRHADHGVEQRPVRRGARVPVPGLSRRAHRGGCPRPLCAGGRRLGVVPGRGRLQLRGRRYCGHRRLLVCRHRRAGGDDHARGSEGREHVPAGEHRRPGLRGGDGQGGRPDRSVPAARSTRDRTRELHDDGASRRRSSRRATASSSPEAAATSRRLPSRCRRTRFQAACWLRSRRSRPVRTRSTHPRDQGSGGGEPDERRLGDVPAVRRCSGQAGRPNGASADVAVSRSRQRPRRGASGSPGRQAGGTRPGAAVSTRRGRRSRPVRRLARQLLVDTSAEDHGAVLETSRPWSGSGPVQGRSRPGRPDPARHAADRAPRKRSGRGLHGGFGDGYRVARAQRGRPRGDSATPTAR